MKYHRERVLTEILACIDTTCLPGQLQELIDIMGLEEAYLFTQSFGGQCKYIPKQPRHNELCRSEVATSRLCHALGGLSIEVPLAKHIDRQLRNREIIAQLENGRSRTQLAREFDLGIRQIANIKRKMSEQ
ncbi:MAG: Mor transcription activator family protein [Aeromonas popoffii]|uniref:Mor transcription activator family protein n=1 Tax=Aeromonas popoffii TaxID=70856 RepID=UPI003F2E54E3